MEIAYVNYGFQSGVTGRLARALEERGHRIQALDVIGPLEYRDRESRRLRPGVLQALHLLAATARFGRQGIHHRWNTPLAFDVHSVHAGALLERLPRAPEVVLQAGALFSPGLAPRLPYVLLLDNTRALAMRSRPAPSAGLGAPLDYGRGWRLREERLYKGALAMAAFSRRVVASLEGDYGIEPGRARVVGAGANLFPEALRRRDDGRTLLFVGTRFDLKGGPVLLRAFSRLRARWPDLRLKIVGPTERLELPAGAEHLGYVSLSQLGALLEQATIFVLPTLREAFGLAFLDAMAHGLPCVGTRVEAVPEIIEDGETGLLAPPEDESALADAIEALLRRPGWAREMGKRAREKVARTWRWHHVAERMEALIRDRLGRRGREAG